MDKEFWNSVYLDDPDSASVSDRILDEELAHLPIGTALDLGCGSGVNALKLAAKGWSVLGIDWADEAITQARAAAEHSGLNARFIVHDAKNWISPLAFDLVIITYALPGAEDNRAMLQTAVSALASGGTLLVVEWDRSIAEKWGMSASDFLSPASIVSMLPGMEIENAQVKHIENMFSGPDDPRWHGEAWANLVVVRVKKP